MGISQDKPAERAYYDALFQTRKRFDQFQEEIYRQIAEEARRGTSGRQALEIGCGSGVQALCLMEQGFSVVAADLSLEATKVARRTADSAGRTLAVVNADAELLPVRDASVDACICGLLLHHFRSLEQIAGEIRRVVRPGGVVVAIDANAHNPFCWLFFNVVHRRRPIKRLTPNQRALWRSEIESVFGKAGFQDFRFSSVGSRLRKDWLGKSLGSNLNYYTRATVLGLSNLVLPQISRGNMLLSVFRRS
jgi:ubiquinone/menaquinone biosynthesis C-methylase UbiE